MKKATATFLLVLTVFTLFTSEIAAKSYQKEAELRSKSAVIYNMQTGMPVFQKSGNKKVMPGATAKIMTGLLALEYYEGRMDTEITVDPFALQGLYGTAALDLKTGEVIAAKHLIYATLVAGMNDAASALALAIGGSFPAFAERMNQKAEELGAYDTVYCNPTGFDHPLAKTTAEDTAKIAAYAYQNPLFMQICSTRAYEVPKTNIHDAVTIYTKNSLLTPQSPSYFKNAEGMCIGYTELAGSTLVTADSSGNFPYIAVVMGAEKAEESCKDAKNLLLWAENNFKEQKVLDVSKIVAELKVTGGQNGDHVLVVPEKSVYAVLDKDTPDSAITYSVNMREEKLQAPVMKNRDVGEILILLDGNPIAGVALVTKSEVPEKSSAAFFRILKNPFFIVTSVILLTLLGIYVYGKYYQNYKKHRHPNGHNQDRTNS